MFLTRCSLLCRSVAGFTTVRESVSVTTALLFYWKSDFYVLKKIYVIYLLSFSHIAGSSAVSGLFTGNLLVLVQVHPGPSFVYNDTVAFLKHDVRITASRSRRIVVVMVVLSCFYCEIMSPAIRHH